MELILDNTYYNNSKDVNYLNKVSYSFKEGINFLYGFDGVLLRDLLFQRVGLKSGYIMVNIEASKKDVYLVSLKEKFKKSSILEEANYINDYYNLNYNNVEQRLSKALIMVGLYNYKDSYFSDLSSAELKKIKIAFALFINSKIIILDYVDKGLCNKDIEYLKKLLRKIGKTYHKNIIICSDDLNNYLDIIDNVIVINNGKVVIDLKKNNLYNDEIYKYLKMPSIIHLIKYLKSKGHVFDNYIEMKELLKAIYRDVENK